MGLNQQRSNGCILIGSGPSLNQLDVTCLAPLHTISFNRSYVAWAAWGFVPGLYASFDPVVVEDNLPEILLLARKHHATQFYLHECAIGLGSRELQNVTYCTVEPGSGFATTPNQLTDFGNAGATSVQLLWLLGFRRIVLIGVDARYRRQADLVVDADGYTRAAVRLDHFCPEYASGKRLRVNPDLTMITGGWQRVASEAAKCGVQVRNATPDSALDCFPTIDFAAGIDWAIHG